MKIFDSHCHLDDRSYAAERDAVVRRAAENDVKAIMCVGIDGERSRVAVELAKTYPACVASVGVHPHDAGRCSEQLLHTLRQLAIEPEVKAWGEIGLDFNRMYAPRADQEKWFVRQLELAAELGLPLIFHERDSGGRFLEMLRRHAGENLKGVVHCFSGSDDELKAYLDMGLYIGITGIVTIKQRGRQLRRQVPLIPAERILVETDAPYLTPAPEKNRTRRNEPAFVKRVLLKVAEVRGEDPAHLADIIWNNTCRLYRINP
jgi:TatD DNase family protein